ncbi:MAG TPA: asparaginase [Thiothrix sp.]|nr:asparaginase [Thiothrix sp.]
MTIKLFITGGTIDKHYNELNGELYFDHSYIPQILQQGRCHANISTEVLLAKDSLEMNEVDRQHILTACQKTKAIQIIITHGTDTMVDTAMVLKQAITNKVIVLVGAMIPYAFKQSDALFNIGCAVTAVQCLTEGVYIIMNGQVFTADNVQKNRQEGCFQQVKK